MSLPKMAYRDGIKQGKQVSFGGYNHALSARDGELYDMRNLTSDHYPILSPRPQRYLMRTLEKPNGLCAYDGLFWVDGSGFYAGGELKGTVSDSRKTFAAMGAYIIIMPDKAYYNRLTGEFGSLEATITCPAGSAAFRDGTYAGEAAERNTIYCASADFAAKFRAGDAVTISGCTSAPENNKTIIVREISEDGHELRFYELSFTAATETGAVTIRRSVPDMDYICVNENRMWGCKGDEIFASKLGDPFNFNVFDGLASDSYSVTVASEGDFTGAAAYLGYACFFKEEHVYKVYGDKPTSFSVMGSASLGIAEGAGRSAAIAGEALFYLARTGIVIWSGGIPQSVAAPFGTERYSDAVGGTDGTKYYVSMKDAAGKWSLFAYDTRYGVWHREDETQAVGFAWDGELYCLAADGRLWLMGRPRELPEGAAAEGDVEWSAEWADIYEYTTYSRTSTPIPEKVGVSKLLLRLALGAGATMKLEISYDGGDWLKVAELKTATQRSYYLPVIPHRADHYRIRMSGKGECLVYSLTREYYKGSAL